MARPIGGLKRRKFPWLALVLLLGSAYALWVFPWQSNGQKQWVGPQAAPQVQTNFVSPSKPPTVNTEKPTENTPTQP